MPVERGARRRPAPPSPAPRREVQGARHYQTGWRDRLRGWGEHHRQVARDSWRRLLASPGGSAMTWLVIGIALALPGGLFVALQNIESLGRGWDGSAQVSLFLEERVSTDRGRALARELLARDDVTETDYVSPEQALEEFRALSGYGDILDGLDSNPIPALILVRPGEGIGADATEALFEALQALPEVERAVLDLQWVQRLYAMMGLGRHLAMALTVLLALGVVLVVGNTIRLAIENRRDEIVITKLVGGTDAFVRRPFLYTGAWYGLGGGIVAWLLIGLTLIWLGGPVARLADLYDSGFRVQGPGLGATLLLWSGGALLGWLGAWLAVGRHLRDVEPR